MMHQQLRYGLLRHRCIDMFEGCFRPKVSWFLFVNTAGAYAVNLITNGITIRFRILMIGILFSTTATLERLKYE